MNEQHAPRLFSCAKMPISWRETRGGLSCNSFIARSSFCVLRLFRLTTNCILMISIKLYANFNCLSDIIEKQSKNLHYIKDIRISYEVVVTWIEVAAILTQKCTCSRVLEFEIAGKRDRSIVNHSFQIDFTPPQVSAKRNVPGHPIVPHIFSSPSRFFPVETAKSQLFTLVKLFHVRIWTESVSARATKSASLPGSFMPYKMHEPRAKRLAPD